MTVGRGGSYAFGTPAQAGDDDSADGVARLGPGVVKGLCSILHRLVGDGSGRLGDGSGRRPETVAVGGGADAASSLPLLRQRRIKVGPPFTSWSNLHRERNRDPEQCPAQWVFVCDYASLESTDYFICLVIKVI